MASSSVCTLVAPAAMSALMRSIFATTSVTDLEPFSTSARNSASAVVRSLSALPISVRVSVTCLSNSAMVSSGDMAGAFYIVKQAAHGGDGGIKRRGVGAGFAEAIHFEDANAARLFAAQQCIKSLRRNDGDFLVVETVVGEPFDDAVTRLEQRLDRAHARLGLRRHAHDGTFDELGA